MANSKAVGVSYDDPSFESVDVSGNVSVGGDITTAGDVGAATATITGAVTGLSFTSASTAAASNAVAGIYFLTTAITANSTSSNAPVGSLGTTSHATGTGKLFISDGSLWQYPVVA